jgi:hypothetical protein
MAEVASKLAAKATARAVRERGKTAVVMTVSEMGTSIRLAWFQFALERRLLRPFCDELQKTWYRLLWEPTEACGGQIVRNDPAK